MESFAEKAKERARDTTNAPFTRLFEFIGVCQLKKIKTIFPNVIQIFSTLA
jgi:hypothetical protein